MLNVLFINLNDFERRMVKMKQLLLSQAVQVSLENIILYV